MNNKLKRLTIELPVKDHERVKIHAIANGLNIRQYVLRALALMMVDDEKRGIL